MSLKKDVQIITEQDNENIFYDTTLAVECKCCICCGGTAIDASVAVANVSDGYDLVWIQDKNEWRDHLGRTPIVKGEKGKVIWCYDLDDWIAIASFY